MIRFSKNEILLLYKMMTLKTGGSVGIKDEALLESALNAPYQTFAMQELYPSILEKAARLGYGLVANHPFVDGNKRIGVFVMMCYLKLNKIDIEFDDEEIINLALGIASSRLNYDDVLELLKSKI